MPELNPEYLSIDFSSILAKLKTELQSNAVFRDYNYEGSNISIMLQLLSYIGELNTYYLNKIAKNVYIETAELYENINRLARQVGYEPKGVRSGQTTVSITVPSGTSGQLYVPAWKQMECSTEQQEGTNIKYATTIATTNTCTTTDTSAGTYYFNVYARQGEVINLTGYKGSDLIDNELLLPMYDYAYDDDVDDENNLVVVEVNICGERWTRVSDFYDDITPTSTDNVYMMVYDRYRRTKIVFNSSRNVPADEDEITITLLKSLGVNSGVGAGKIDTAEDEFVYNNTTSEWLDSSTLTFSNSAATIGSADAEDINIIRENAKAAMHSQFRNVTSVDYKTHLESRSDIDTATAWGEQEINPSGSTIYYNKVYISVIPANWSTGTINTSAAVYMPTIGTTGSILRPTSYNTTWVNTLKTYMEPRKMLNAYEIFQLPELVYFHFDFGVRTKKFYQLDEVKDAILNKLTYYFRATNQDFNSEVDFKDIYNYLMDITETSPTDDFTDIKGIDNLIFRDIECSVDIYEPNNALYYPQFTTAAWTGDNTLRPIQLGNNQFPMLSVNTITFTAEF